MQKNRIYQKRGVTGDSEICYAVTQKWIEANCYFREIHMYVAENGPMSTYVIHQSMIIVE